MAYIPRRRLVLAGVHAGSVHAQGFNSQMPWDAEEAASANVAQELESSSQVACHTQEAVITADHRYAYESQTHDKARFPDSACPEEDRWTAVQAPECASYGVQQASEKLWSSAQTTHSLPSQSNTSAAAQLTLSLKEYAEIYDFLTRGTGHVQEASTKERALYKLTDLRQVLPPHLHTICLLLVVHGT